MKKMMFGLAAAAAIGAFAIESANVSVKANILQDGTMALEFAAGDTATTLYFEKAE